MEGCPDAAVESRGSNPDGPVSASIAGSPRHSSCVGDGERVVAGVALRVVLADCVGPGELVCVANCVRVAEPEPETLPLGELLRSEATLRPRYVSRAKTSSGVSPTPPPLPPPPLPASHNSADSRSPLAMVLEGTSCVTLANRKHSEAGVASQCRAGS